MVVAAAAAAADELCRFPTASRRCPPARFRRSLTMAPRERESFAAAAAPEGRSLLAASMMDASFVLVLNKNYGNKQSKNAREEEI